MNKRSLIFAMSSAVMAGLVALPAVAATQSDLQGGDVSSPSGVGSSWSAYGTVEIPDIGVMAGEEGQWYKFPINIHSNEVCEGAQQCKITLTAPDSDVESKWLLTAPEGSNITLLDPAAERKPISAKSFEVDATPLRAGEYVTLWYSGKVESPLSADTSAMLSVKIDYGKTPDGRNSADFLSQKVSYAKNVVPYDPSNTQFVGYDANAKLYSNPTTHRPDDRSPLGVVGLSEEGAHPKANYWYMETKPGTVKLVKESLPCPFLPKIDTAQAEDFKNLPEGVVWNPKIKGFEAKDGYAIHTYSRTKFACIGIYDPRTSVKPGTAAVDDQNSNKPTDNTAIDNSPSESPSDNSQSDNSIDGLVPKFEKPKVDSTQSADVVIVAPKNTTNADADQSAQSGEKNVAGKRAPKGLAKTGSTSAVVAGAASLILLVGASALGVRRILSQRGDM